MLTYNIFFTLFVKKFIKFQVEALIFSSLISAVDPVAVLAIFEEIHVNSGLYFLVFGESLFNDGVTIVLYNNLKALENMNVGPIEVSLSFLSFVLVVIGGLLIGALLGILVSFLTTKTESTRVSEPLLIFSFFYMAFILAEMVHWSGIMSIIGYGLIVKNYAFINISNKSYTTIKYTTKTVATSSEVIIFIFMGIVTISERHLLHWGFIISTFVFCTIYRFIGTFLLSWITNLRRGNHISFQEQFIMGYGGLRGAVGFSLAMMIDDHKWYKNLFVSTALSMVFVTVFIQGSTIKFFVKLLGIKLKSQIKGSQKLFLEIQNRVVDDVMGGIEAVVGSHGHYKTNIWLNHFDENYMKKWLVNKNTKEKLEHMFEKTVLDDHFTNLYGPNIISKKCLGYKIDLTDGENSEKGCAVSNDLSHVETFSNAAAKHPWRMNNTKMSRRRPMHSQYLREQMGDKQERSKNMENRIIIANKEIDNPYCSNGSDDRFSPVTSLILKEYHQEYTARKR